MLEIKNLTFAHPGQTTPYKFNLTAAPGKITAISGPSGIGKSTLLDLVAGFLTPMSGAISLHNRSLKDMQPQSRPVSILFQDDNLFDHLTVKTNLQLGLPPKSKNSRQKITAALAQVDLEEFIDRPAKNLSGGQQQRVALARTLLRNKPILLLDEPFANLDKNTADKMRALVKQLTLQNNWITLIVSHLNEDVTNFADQVYPLT